MQVMNTDIVPPRERDHKVNKTLELICMKCLAREPNQRYSSAAALADDLENWLDGKPVSVRPPSRGLAVVDVLRGNLKTAVGAAMCGIVAGYLFAFCLSKCTTDGAIMENPPTKVYAALPAEFPIGRSLAFMKEDEPRLESGLGFLGSLAVTCFVGFAVVVVSRPKPGSEAVAFGMVAGLLMSIVMFTLQIGFTGLKESHEETRSRVKTLAQMAIGTQEQSEAASKSLYNDYPALADLPTEERANTLAFRIFYDALYKVPTSILFGILAVTILCMLPCLAGTAFASKLLHERGRLRWSLPAYTEFSLLIVVLAFLIFLETCTPGVGSQGPDVGLVNRYDRQAIVYSFFIIMAVIIYRRSLRWWWRLLIYVGFIVCCFLLP